MVVISFSLQSLSGLQSSMLARDEAKGPSQSGGTNGSTLKIPQGVDWLWKPGQVNRPASRTAFQVEGFAWIMAQRQESSETVRGRKHRRDGEEEREAREGRSGLIDKS